MIYFLTPFEDCLDFECPTSFPQALVEEFIVLEAGQAL
jgi:hypothetical protein